MYELYSLKRELLNFRQSFDIREKVKSLDADFGGIKISTPEILDFVQSMKSFDEKMQYSKYEDMVSSNRESSGDINHELLCQRHRLNVQIYYKYTKLWPGGLLPHGFTQGHVPDISS